ncbi:MAG: protein kinase domain-containing protein, partial [Acidobacteriota bacterium]
MLGELGPGARIGEYVIERSAPTRGTGHLYEATHRVLPRRVTLKVLPAAAPWNSALAVQLLREACIVEALDHPGIPRVYECGTLADRRPWVATEIVVGPTLTQQIATRALSVVQVVAIVRDVAETLAYAHARGLVHRAVSPRAIVFPPGARRFPLCLVDWSSARTRDSTTPLPFAPPLAVAPYLAPEQLRGGDTDDRGDVFALGMVARELIDTIGRA